jgi:hypothetical protein
MTNLEVFRLAPIKNWLLGGIFTALVSGVVLFSARPIAAQSQGGNMYSWCWTAPLNSSIHKMFYSNVFSIQSGQITPAINNGFRAYVMQTYPNDNTGNGECQGPYATQSDATKSLNQNRSNSRDFNHLEVIDTGWSP